MSEPVRVHPMDQYNEALVSHLHPPDWVNPAPAERYNLVVIGGGPAGLVVAAGAAGLGARVALVERRLLGGDCLNVGCVPSKCLIRAARAAADVRRAGDFGVRVPDGVTVDFPAVMERMRRLRSGLSHHDSAARFRDLGVDIFLGEGRFTGDHTFDVNGAQLHYHTAVIATGARAVTPPVEGIEEAGFLTNETVFELTELPKRLAVFGAGPLGCELAQAFQRFGSDVTIIEMQGHLLMREDSDAAAVIADAFRRDGVSVRCDTTVCRVERTDEGKVLHMNCDSGEDDLLVVDELLVGAGRAPNVQGLNLEAVAVAYDERKGVAVNDFMQTTNHDIYAAGDICQREKFTHTADAAARIVIQNALFPSHKRYSGLVIPLCTYTDPEIAHVGLYERDAEDGEIKVTTFMERFSEIDRAVTDSATEGLIKVHVEEGSDRILGATIVAEHAGEMINEITLAMVADVGLGKISGVVHPYPTQAEAIRRTADAYNRTRLKPFVKMLFDRYLSWTR